MFKKKLGIDVSLTHPEPPRKKHIKRYASVLIFIMRCKRYAEEWREQLKVKAMLNRALEAAREERLRGWLVERGRG